MNVTTENYISKAKDLILDEDLESLETLWNTIAQVIRDRSKAISYDLIFRDCYFFSINQKKIKVIKWLEDHFQEFDPVIQNRLRQIMTYAKYLADLRSIERPCLSR
jgi:hypothetical protein